MAVSPQQESQEVLVEDLWLRTMGEDYVPDSVIRHRLRSGRRAGGNRLRLGLGLAAVVAASGLIAFAATPAPQPSRPASPSPPSLLPEFPERPPRGYPGSAPVPESKPATTTTPAPPPGIPSVPAAPAPASGPRRAASPPPASAVPAVPRAPAALPAVACTVRYVIRDSWPDGFTASVFITNTGRSAFSPWTLTWTFTAGQQITHGWNGEYTQSGNRVTVRAASYNATIAPSGTVEFGFNGSHTSANPRPADFAVNETRCELAN